MKTTVALVGFLAICWTAGAQSIQGIVTPPVLPAGFTGAAYSLTLYSGSGPFPFGWQLTSGTLPAGLALSAAGVISGTPTTVGTSTFVITFEPDNNASQTFTLTVVAGPPHFVVTPSTLPAASALTSYPQNLVATGGAGPYSWTITSGALPSGLTSLYTADDLSCTPACSVEMFGGAVSVSAVTSTFTVTVTDATSASVSQTFTLPITLAISPANSLLPSGMVGAPYSQAFTAAGGAGAPYTWSTTSALPPGLALSTAGVLSGTPTSYGTWTLSIAVADVSSTKASQTFALTINPAPLVIVTTTSLPAGVAGTPYSQTLTATGGVAPYVWTLLSGSLPPLLTLSTSGVISGTPTTPGSASFTISVADSGLRAASQLFTLVINTGTLTIASPAALPSAVVGVAYSQALAATGGVAPYTWQIVSGSWPAGLIMSSAGAITGTPTSAGSYAFAAKVTDSASEAATQSFSLTVIAAGSLSREGIISQVVAGDGWTTTIWLVNRTSAAVQISLVFHGDDGSPLSLPFTVTQQASSQAVTASTLTEAIAPNTTLVVATGTLVANVEGWADVLSNSSLSGFAVFSNGTAEAAVPLQSPIGTSISLPFDNTNGASTGVALVNLAGGPASLTAMVWDQYGNQLAVLPVTLTQNDAGGGGHDSFMLPARLGVTAGIRGIVQFQGNPGSPFTAAGQLTGLGLRAEPSGLFTSIPTIVP